MHQDSTVVGLDVHKLPVSASPYGIEDKCGDELQFNTKLMRQLLYPKLAL